MAYIEEEGHGAGSAKGVTAGLLVFAAVFFLCGGLEPRQRLVAAIFAATVALWILEALPLAVTAMLSTSALVATGAMTSRDAFGTYGDPLILLFIGSFILAKSMEENRLDARIAAWLMTKPWATQSTSQLLLVVGIATCLVSVFVNNAATAVLLLPIVVAVLRRLGVLFRGNPISTSMLLMLTWASSISLGTIFDTPPNMIGASLIDETAGVRLGAARWAIIALPLTLALLAFAWFQLSRWRMDTYIPSPADDRAEAENDLRELGPVSRGEKVTLFALGLTLVLWIMPSVVRQAFGGDSTQAAWWINHVPAAIPALLGITLLFAIPTGEDQRALTWQEATKIDWGTILLFAGGLALGKATYDSGLAQHIGESVSRSVGSADVWTVTAIATALAILLSEMMSNTASATVAVPIAIALAQGSRVDIVPPALGATLGANLGFMLPVSSAPNAIVYASGLMPANVMLRAGLWFDLVGFAATMIVLRIALPVLGLA